MRVHVRFSLLALLVGVLVAASATAAQAAAPSVASFYAANCKVNTCKKVPPAEEKEKAELEGFTQAAGHPNFGITDFTVSSTGAPPKVIPDGILTHIRTDVAPGVATNPESPEKCTFEEFGKEFEPAPGAHTGLYEAPGCSEPGSLIGVNQVVVWVEAIASDLPLEGKVYNLLQPTGLASDFGVALPLPKALTEALLKIPTPQLYAHTLIEGNVEWGAEANGTGKADYHDYFEIKVSPLLPLLSSRLVFNGRAGAGGKEAFITNPTSCTGIGPQTTTHLKLEFEAGETASALYETPIGTSECGAVPFNPGFAFTQGSKTSDATDALLTELSLPHQEGGAEIDSSQVNTATVTLPPGLTLNPSAASGLEACTPAEIGIGTKNPISCPEGSDLGTVSLDVPGLPSGSLQGHIYLGGPESGPITAPPYTLYVAASSDRYGVVVRVKGETTPDPVTGRLTTVFKENPEQPFSNLTLHFNGGTLAPLANGLSCEASTATTTFTPFTNTEAKSPTGNFEITGCAAPLSFAPTQASTAEPAQGGANTTFTLNFVRPQGNQYLA